MLDIHHLLATAIEKGASDLHVTVGSPPALRIHGEIRVMDLPALTGLDTETMLTSLLTQDQLRVIQAVGQLDFAHQLEGTSRFRINAFRQKGYYSLAVRVVPWQVPQLSNLGLPQVIVEICARRHGLILVTGPTGSGKSTTLAAMVDWLNRHNRQRIVTLEDPIEFLHVHRNSLIDQREIGVDTESFASGLRAALRQNADVLLIGEMRDLETIATALTAAETGHLVLATLHTADAPQAVERIIDVFPPVQQAQVRVQLANVLQTIVAQRLIPTVDGAGRVAAVEILVNTPAVANLIRGDKIHQVRTAMQTGKLYGMQTMAMSVRDWVAVGRIHDPRGDSAVEETAR